MRYPTVGEQVRVKGETGLHTVVQQWKPGRVLLDDGRIFYLGEIVTRHQKTVLTYVIQVYYPGTPYGWEDVTEEETLSEARDRRKEYRENVQYPVRLIRRREPNPLWKGE